jgi:hypothetical protein
VVWMSAWPIHPGGGGCRPWRSCGCRTWGADRGSEDSAGRPGQAQPCSGGGAPNRREVPTSLANTRSSSPIQFARRPSWARARTTSGANGTARTFPDFGSARGQPAASRERHAGPAHARRRAAAGLVEHVAQPGLGGALREVSGRRPAAVGPGGAELLLDLRPSASLYLAYQTRRRAPSRRKTLPVGIPADVLARQSQTLVATNWRQSSLKRESRPYQKPPTTQQLLDAAGGTRTHDRRSKSRSFAGNLPQIRAVQGVCF